MRYLDDLKFWVTERESIRSKREQELPPPWTSDPIMANNRFCNVHREDDKVTRWIHHQWLHPNAKLSSVQFAMCVARTVNHPETLSELGYPHQWDIEHFISTIQKRKARKEKCWTSAYMITGGFSAGGESKEVIIGRVLETAHNGLEYNPIVEGDSLYDASVKLKYPGIGSFLSAQIIADLKWVPILRNARDWNQWCSPGPGSTAGLNLLFDRPVTLNLSQPRFQREVGEIQAILAAYGYPLDAQNVQNCLCEFSKYVRIKYLGGRAKASYRATV